MTRVAVGFHRIGVVLALPLLLIAAWQSYREWIEPTGSYVTELPAGSDSYALSEGDKPSSDPITESLVAEQSNIGIRAPAGTIVVGKVLRVERNKDGVEQTIYQVRDGRIIAISTPDAQKARLAAFNFLWHERQRGHDYTDKDDLDTQGFHVNFIDQLKSATLAWLIHRQRDWTMPLEFACLALGLYVTARALGWIVDGFVSK